MKARLPQGYGGGAGNLNNLMKQAQKAQEDMAAKPAESMDAMVYCHDVIIPDMVKAREISDELETITAGKNWPFPVYSELLFSV